MCSGRASADQVAPPAFWAMKFTLPAAAASARNGIFSTTKTFKFRIPNSAFAIRPSGQKSASSSTNGSVTTIGLDIRPQANRNSTSRYKSDGWQVAGGPAGWSLVTRHSSRPRA